MEPDEVARHWEANADAWSRLSRAGYDIYRDALNTPAFLAMLPPVASLEGLGIGFRTGDAMALPYPDQAFDFAAAFMCLMDMPDPGRALREA